MKFAIRDDDTNYFTNPEKLESIYKDIWEICPISLAVVPFQGCTRSGALPEKYWTGNKIFPINQNKALVNFLKEKIKENKISIMLHGYTHKDNANGFEFETSKNLYKKVRAGKEYLEKIFKTKIRSFVPPHNILSDNGLRAVVANELNIVNIPSFRFGKRPLSSKTITNLIKQKYFLLQHKHFYPFPLMFEDHKEIISHCLTPLINFEQLKEVGDFYRKMNGDFCLAVHYWEFGVKQKYNTQFTVGERFQGFWNYIHKFKDIKFCTVDQLFEESL